MIRQTLRKKTVAISQKFLDATKKCNSQYSSKWKLISLTYFDNKEVIAKFITGGIFKTNATCSSGINLECKSDLLY